MVGFDDGLIQTRILDGNPVNVIYPDLSSDMDLTQAKYLNENKGIAFHGTVQSGPFDINATTAMALINSENLNNYSNSDVVKPWVNALDITRRPRNKWAIDFGVDLSIDNAKKYEKPFDYIYRQVKPIRDNVRRKQYREKWWLFAEPCAGMRQAIASLNRFIVTPKTARHRLFVWLSHPTIPDQALYVIARDDDYFFGILHSRAHELWVRRKGTQLREAKSGSRYSPTETFETFPFPWPPGQEPSEYEDIQVATIANAARKLVEIRHVWLQPEGVGITISQEMVNRRTLTHLYNALEYYRTSIRGKQRNPTQWVKDTGGIITLDEIEELDHIHTEIDQAVLDAYGWPHSLTDMQILEHLLALNMERAAA